MPTDTVAIQVPEPLYHRLQRLADLTQRPLESLVVQALSSSIPLLPDDLPAAMRDALLALENLSDSELQRVANTTFSTEQYERLAALREKHQTSTLAESEQATLDHLLQEADLLTLRKAYAAVLLKWHGHQLPTLAELEAQP
jgi:hypothetical protein